MQSRHNVAALQFFLFPLKKNAEGGRSTNYELM